jgi:hypothetical protein
MKRLSLLILLFICCATAGAQSYTYSSLKYFLNREGIETDDISVEKRTRNQISLYGGADYRIQVHENKKLSKYLRKRCFVVEANGELYVNCRKLRYHKLKFGGWYAPALQIASSDNIFFSAVPLGTVAGQKQHGMDVTLGGPIGDAIATSSLVSKRVYYEIDATTGRVELVDVKRMRALLGSDKKLLKEYKKEESDSAKITGKYLKSLRDK